MSNLSTFEYSQTDKMSDTIKPMNPNTNQPLNQPAASTAPASVHIAPITPNTPTVTNINSVSQPTRGHKALTVFILLLILAGIIIFYKWNAIQPYIASLTGVEVIPENNLENIPQNMPQDGQNEAGGIVGENAGEEITDIKGKAVSQYFSTVEKNGEIEYRFFKVSEQLDEKNALTHAFTLKQQYPSIFTDSGKANTILFISNAASASTIYALDISTVGNKPQVLTTIPLNQTAGEHIDSVHFIDQGNTLLYITNTSDNEIAENVSLHTMSLATKEKQDFFITERGALYAGFHFLSSTNNDRTIYLFERGGDAGQAWETWYSINRDTKAVQKLANFPQREKNTGNPVMAEFSPDGSKIAYTDSSAEVPEAELDYGAYDNFETVRPCFIYNNNTSVKTKYENEGGVIMIKNGPAGAAREIFRNNKVYSDNLCKIAGRRVSSLEWIDNTSLLFSTIDGIYTIDADGKNLKTVYIFPRTGNPGTQYRPSVISMNLPFIAFSDGTVVNTQTNKVVNLHVEGANYFRVK